MSSLWLRQVGGPDHETEGTSLSYTAEAKAGASEYRPPFWCANLLL